MLENKQKHIVASYVAPTALTPGTRAALRALGYELAPAIMRGRWDDASWRSDIRLVDERQLLGRGQHEVDRPHLLK